MTIHPNFTNIPAELRARPQWVVWKYGKLRPNGKREKVPFHPTTGKAASTTKPVTWGTFEQALTTYRKGGYTGIGYVLTNGDPFTFIDIDDCIRNDELAPGAMATVKRFGSYSERSVSGTGIHIIIEGNAPNRKVEPNECYSHSRFVALTGAIIADQRTIEPRQDVLDAWYRETFPPVEDRPTAPTAHAATVATDDNALLDRIYASKQAARFAALMAGDTTGYPSHSEADGALCAILAFWTDHDPAQMDRIFRQSGLMRTKWDRIGDGATQRTVGQLTIDNAIRQVRNGYRPPKNEGSRVKQICDTWRSHSTARPMHSATQRVLLATLRKFEQADTLTTYISSRNVSDLTGLSHPAAMLHLRLLCPQARAARLKRLQCDLNRADAQLRAAGNATTAAEMLLTIRPQERAAILAKCGNQGNAAIMAEIIIFLTARRGRATSEMRFYATHPPVDILDVTEAHDGSALATVYTLRTPTNSANSFHINPLITVGGAQQHCDHDPCGKNLQSSQRDALAFIEGEMTDDAFVVVPPTKRDPRLKLEPDPIKRKRLAALLAPDERLKPFGLSAPVVFAHLTAHPGATVDDLTVATGLSERTVRSILKATGPALVEGGHLPLVEAQKLGRKLAYTLADDWRERLDSLRPDLASNGVIAARAVFHAGERIQRIDRFLAQGLRDHRRPLDEATKAQYEEIKARAQQLQARILGRSTPTVQPDALALSDDLVTVEAALVKAMAPALTPALTLAPATVTKETPAPRVVRYLIGDSSEPFFWSQ